MISLIKRDFIFSRIAFIVCYIAMVFTSFLMNLSMYVFSFEFKIRFESLLLLFGTLCGVLTERKYQKVSDLLVAVGYSRKIQILERYVLAIGSYIIAIISEIIIEVCLIFLGNIQFSCNIFGIISSTVFIMLVINFFMVILYSNQWVQNIAIYVLIFGNMLLHICGINLNFLTLSRGIGVYFIIPTIIITIGTFKFCVFLDGKEYNKK